MSTLKNLVDEIILEKKIETLKLFYDIDVFIQDFKNNEPTTPEPATPEPATPATPEPTTSEPTTPEAATPEAVSAAPTESTKISNNLLNEDILLEAIIKAKLKGELTVSREDAANIQTIQDIVDYLTDHKHIEKSIIEKVLDKKGTVKGKDILTPEIQELILLFIGAGSDKNLGDIINKGDKINIDIDYGTDKNDSIGLKINKNSGTTSYSTMIKKDGKILSGKFDRALINKQILFYRNSLEG